MLQMVPIFVSLLITEEIIHYVKYGKLIGRLNDGMTSIALGLIMEVTK